MSGRLAAVGELAAGIAHEINNPIAFVRANLTQLHTNLDAIGDTAAARLLARDGSLDTLIEEGRELVQESLEGVDRTCDICLLYTSDAADD